MGGIVPMGAKQCFYTFHKSVSLYAFGLIIEGFKAQILYYPGLQEGKQTFIRESLISSICVKL